VKAVKKRGCPTDPGAQPLTACPWGKKGGRLPFGFTQDRLCQGSLVKYAWIREHNDEFSITPMCRFIPSGAQVGVSQSACYGWLRRKPAPREQGDGKLTPIIQSIFADSRATHGTRRIRQTLQTKDLPVGRKRTSRLMRAAGSARKTKRKVKATTDSKHW